MTSCTHWITHYGEAMAGMYGPDVTFLGVERCDLADEAALRAADMVVLGAPTTPTSRRSGPTG